MDLQQIVAERFGVAYHERTVGKILKQLGFSYVSARPRHPAKDEETVAAFKNVCPAPSASGFERGDLTGLRQRIRSRGRAPAKMEFRAPLVLIDLRRRAPYLNQGSRVPINRQPSRVHRPQTSLTAAAGLLRAVRSRSGRHRPSVLHVALA